MHHGRHKLDEQQPVIGSWIHYGLGTLNENLPQFVFLGQYKDPRVQRELRRRLPRPAVLRRRAVARPGQPAAVRHAARGRPRPRSRRNEFAFIRELNRLVGGRVPRGRPAPGPDQGVRAGLPDAGGRSPRSLDLAGEPAETQRLYGIDQDDHGGLRPPPARRPPAGRARRAVRAGLPQRLRRVGLAHPAQGPARPVVRPGRPADRRPAQGPEAARADRRRHGRLLHRVRPHAGPGDPRRHDRRRRPAATTTRTPSPSGSPARGSRAGPSTGRPTSSASTPSSTPTTSPTSTPRVLHLLGLDPRRLDVPGRKRLEIDYGRPIREILA